MKGKNFLHESKLCAAHMHNLKYDLFVINVSERELG